MTALRTIKDLAAAAAGGTAFAVGVLLVGLAILVLFFIGAVVVGAVSILAVFTGVGLLRMRNWARWAVDEPRSAAIGNLRTQERHVRRAYDLLREATARG
jgi:hypothetical protein